MVILNSGFLTSLTTESIEKGKSDCNPNYAIDDYRLVNVRRVLQMRRTL